MKTLHLALSAGFGALAVLASTPAAHATLRDATMNLQSTGSAIAIGSFVGPVVTAEGSFDQSSAAITHYFEVSGPQIGTVVPININGDWNASAYRTAVATGQLTTGLDLAHGDFTRDLVFVCGEADAFYPNNFHIREQALAGYEWTLLINASGNWNESAETTGRAA